ncbi:WD40 repeat domain-containing protein [Aeoliella sp.]|uniref:WD40 repeat domain-containing protein n=1 Tax=Aeoliella sp. TaxID=2795800 RepID=UPI003CCBBE6E
MAEPSAPAAERASSPALDSLGDPLPDGAILRMGTQRFRHPSSVTQLALSPDGDKVMSIGSDELIAWNRSTGKELWRTGMPRNMSFSAAAYGMRPLVFSSNSHHFFTIGPFNQLLVWDLASGESRAVNLNSSLSPQVLQMRTVGKSIDVTRDETKFAVGFSSGVVVCDSEGRVHFEIENNPTDALDFNSRDRLRFGGHYSYAVFSPDEKTLAVVTSDAPTVIRLHDATTGEEMRRIELTDRLVRMAFSPDGKHIVGTERDIAARQYAVDTCEEVWAYKIEPTTKAESYTSGVAYSPNADIIAVGAPIGADHDIHLLTAEDGKLKKVLTGHQWKPWTVAFSDDGKTLFSSGWDGAVRRWDMETLEQLPLPVGVRATRVVTLSPVGDRVAYEDDSGAVHVLHGDGTVERTLTTPNAGYAQLKFSGDGKWLCGGGTIGDQVHVIVWNVEDGAVRKRWEWPKGKDPHSHVECLDFSSDGKYLAAAVFRQSAAYLWDLSTDEPARKLPHGEVYGLSFSPAGDVLATAGWDRKVRFWNSADGQLQRDFEVNKELGNGGDNRMYTVCYSPKEDTLATAHLDGKVRLWDAAEMRKLREFQVPGRFVYGTIAFSPDGWLLATGSMTGAVQLWEPWTGQEVRNLGKHDHYAYTVGFGPGRQTLVSGGSDGVCYLWDLEPPDLPAHAEMPQLWSELRGDADTAYRAMWTMQREPQQAAEFLVTKLRGISTVIDRGQAVTEQPTAIDERQERLLSLLAQKDDKVETHTTVRRAMVALEQLDTPAASQALEELARDANAEAVLQLASQALMRLADQQ